MGYDSVGKEEFRTLVKRLDTLEGRVQVLEDKLAEVKKPFLAEINRPGVEPVAALVANEEAPILTSTDTYDTNATVSLRFPNVKPGWFTTAKDRILGVNSDVEPVQEEKEPG